MLQGTSKIEEATAEIAFLMTSPTFARSPRTARLLDYLCKHYLAGELHQITEYNIAVEVLGRPKTFVPADDAIARVEVHRLRKKLRDFYLNEGSTRHLRVVIPTGSYVPDFVAADSPGEGGTPVAQIVAVKSALAAQASGTIGAQRPAVQTRNNRYLYFIGAGVATLLVVVLVARGRQPAASDAAGRNVDRSPGLIAEEALADAGLSVRFCPGRKTAFTDHSGKDWATDRFYSGGEPYEAAPRPILRTHDPELFLGGRTGNFSYEIPLKAGTYEMRLYFAETTFGPDQPKDGGEGTRLFHIVANGHRILSDFDVYTDSGGANIADIRVFKDVSPDRDGQLHLRFISGVDRAMVSAIELSPARPHRMNPVRITAQDRPYLDSRGLKWWPDNYRIGGRTATPSGPVRSNDPELYTAELYGNIDYAIPVADGIYNLAIYLAETYWGPENPGGNGNGNRVFQILCNGVLLARSVDIYNQTGAGRPLVLHYNGLAPNPQGKLHLNFVPVKNYASVFAIEIEDAAR